MEKAAQVSQESLKLISSVKFTLNGFTCPALINTGIDNNIINVKEMMRMPDGLVYMSMHGHEHVPMALAGPRQHDGDDGPYYSTKLEIEINGDKEAHLFEFHRHPRPDYIVELGLHSTRGRLIDTR